MADGPVDYYHFHRIRYFTKSIDEFHEKLKKHIEKAIDIAGKNINQIKELNKFIQDKNKDSKVLKEFFNTLEQVDSSLISFVKSTLLESIKSTDEEEFIPRAARQHVNDQVFIINYRTDQFDCKKSANLE